MRRMPMKIINGELMMILEMIKDIIWVRSNHSLFQMFFWNSHSKSQTNIQTKILKGSTAGIWPQELLLCRRRAAWWDLSSFPHYICLHFLIIFVFISSLYLYSFPHYICLHFLIIFVFISSLYLPCTSCSRFYFFTITCARISLHRFWIPLAVTLTWWAVIFLSAGNYRSSHCYLKLLQNSPWEQIK